MTEEGWKVPIEFTTTTGDDVAQVICDLNKPSRAIRQRPAIRRPFESKFTTLPVSIWVSRPEEIIGEKIGALLRRRNGRLRDIHDIAHLLGIAKDLELDTSTVRVATKDALQDLLPLTNLRESLRRLIVARANEEDDLEWVLDEISSIGYNARADSWAQQVGDIVLDAGTPTEETDRLAGLWRDLRLLERP